jgi:hypothetical protein
MVDSKTQILFLRISGKKDYADVLLFESQYISDLYICSAKSLVQCCIKLTLMFPSDCVVKVTGMAPLVEQEYCMHLRF